MMLSPVVVAVVSLLAVAHGTLQYIGMPSTSMVAAPTTFVGNVVGSNIPGQALVSPLASIGTSGSGSLFSFPSPGFQGVSGVHGSTYQQLGTIYRPGGVPIYNPLYQQPKKAIHVVKPIQRKSTHVLTTTLKKGTHIPIYPGRGKVTNPSRHRGYTHRPIRGYPNDRSGYIYTPGSTNYRGSYTYNPGHTSGHGYTYQPGYTRGQGRTRGYGYTHRLGYTNSRGGYPYGSGYTRGHGYTHRLGYTNSRGGYPYGTGYTHRLGYTSSRGGYPYGTGYTHGYGSRGGYSTGYGGQTLYPGSYNPSYQPRYRHRYIFPRHGSIAPISIDQTSLVTGTAGGLVGSGAQDDAIGGLHASTIFGGLDLNAGIFGVGTDGVDDLVYSSPLNFGNTLGMSTAQYGTF